MRLLLLCALTVMIQAHAKNLGTIGKTTPVIEMDFLTFIQQKATAWVASDGYKRQQKIIVRGVDKYMRYPSTNLARHTTDHPRTYYIDPSIKRKDILFQSNKIGLINPFNYIFYQKTLVFLDANDKKQLHWFKQFSSQHTNVIHLILIDGDTVSVSKQFKRRVFFDQHGKLTDYFQLKHVPVVIQEDESQKQWRVQEINVFK